MTTTRLTRNAAASVTQVILTGATLMLMYRLLVQSLTIEQIGLWALVIGSIAVARLSEMGLGAGVVRFVARDIGSGERDLAAGTVGMATLCVGALVATVAFASRPVLLYFLLKAIPPSQAGDARVLLPTALVALVIATVANVFANAVDGCQRMDIRSGIQIVGGFVQLGTTFFVLPRYGMVALGWAQIAQASFLLVANLAVMLILIRAPLRSYVAFNASRLRELLSYGGGLQLTAVVQLLFEPLTKVLLTTFSGLALTGYFDMANRLIMQFRGVILAGYNALVPHVAAQAGNEQLREYVRQIYRESLSMLMMILLPYSAVVCAAMPLAITLWSGRFDRSFLGVALVLFVGWSINTLTPPAYLLFVGVGRLRWNMLAHLLMGVITLVLGVALGMLIHGPGVLIAAMLGLVAGSFLLIAAFHREFDIALGELMPGRRWPELLLVLAALGASTSIALQAPSSPSWFLLIGLPVVVGVIATGLTWHDPAQARLTARLRQAVQR